MELLDDMLFVP
jgi:hypothetical protein